MNELAARMKYADRFTPIAASQIVARWVRRDNLAHPKIHNPRNVDSRKNATNASIANGAPNTSPTNREYSLQFIPNWNSCTIPVTIPIAKLISNNLPKNFVNRSQCSLPVRYQAVCMMATNGAKPIVSGTKMKWYTVVMPNCHLDRSSTFTDYSRSRLRGRRAPTPPWTLGGPSVAPAGPPSHRE